MVASGTRHETYETRAALAACWPRMTAQARPGTEWVPGSCPGSIRCAVCLRTLVVRRARRARKRARSACARSGICGVRGVRRAYERTHARTHACMHAFDLPDPDSSPGTLTAHSPRPSAHGAHLPVCPPPHHGDRVRILRPPCDPLTPDRRRRRARGSAAAPSLSLAVAGATAWLPTACTARMPYARARRPCPGDGRASSARPPLLAGFSLASPRRGPNGCTSSTPGVRAPRASPSRPSRQCQPTAYGRGARIGTAAQAAHRDPSGGVHAGTMNACITVRVHGSGLWRQVVRKA